MRQGIPAGPTKTLWKDLLGQAGKAPGTLLLVVPASFSLLDSLFQGRSSL